MIALMDCNNFFVSCERTVRPDLEKKPVLVLSNNDGCVIARSNEVKALGIKMGQPFFQIKELVKKHGINCFSSNFILYEDVSHRVMQLLEQFAPNPEVYSVDEAFLHLPDDTSRLRQIGNDIVKTIDQQIGIPVSVGIAPTKTLAKAAADIAKKDARYHGVACVDTPAKIATLQGMLPIGDVWGIGRRYAQFLTSNGIVTAKDFVDKPQQWVRRHMSVVGEKTWRELQGEPCFEYNRSPEKRQQIMVSRSFGSVITTFEALRGPVALFAASAAHKLRQQGMVAAQIEVFLSNGRFPADNAAKVWQSTIVPFATPVSNTTEITNAALQGLKCIVSNGVKYKQAGVVLRSLSHQEGIQADLFDTVDHDKHQKISAVMDRINQSYGRNYLRLAIQATESPSRQEMLSSKQPTRTDERNKKKH